MPIKSTTIVQTTITHQFSVQEFAEWLNEKSLIPKEWKGCSIEVVGLGVSKGANIVLENMEAKK